MSGKEDKRPEEPTAKDGNDMTKCPDCGHVLQKCLIQQNYAMILCPNEECGYPFNQHENIEHMVYVDDNDVLEAAGQRLAKK
ncbi:hypothetical protein MOUN0_O12046 [Monosporozyma unispora]|nr:hypothetical protein C6P44_000036 [Kazachstania unispora]